LETEGDSFAGVHPDPAFSLAKSFLKKFIRLRRSGGLR
jgi:hypothetical protein